MPKPIEESLRGGSQSQTVEGHPTREEIELRAYQIYLARGRTPGNDVEDWLQAECELVEKHGKSGHLAKAAAV